VKFLNAFAFVMFIDGFNNTCSSCHYRTRSFFAALTTAAASWWAGTSHLAGFEHFVAEQ